MCDTCVLLLNKLLKDASLVLWFRFVNFADQFPNLAPQAFTVNFIEALVEALSDARVRQVIYLQSKIRIQLFLILFLLNRIHKDYDPLFLSVRQARVKLVDWLVKKIFLDQWIIEAVQFFVPLFNHFCLFWWQVLHHLHIGILLSLFSFLNGL